MSTPAFTYLLSCSNSNKSLSLPHICGTSSSPQYQHTQLLNSPSKNFSLHTHSHPFFHRHDTLQIPYYPSSSSSSLQSLTTTTTTTTISMRSSDETTAASTEKYSALSIETLKSNLESNLEGLFYGLVIDADAETIDDQENNVEDIIEQLEDLNTCQIPTRDLRMSGSWQLIYTSSTITRYFGGLTGLQRYFPEGKIIRIDQNINIEDGNCILLEKIQFNLPFTDKQLDVDAIVTGKFRPINEIRHDWTPDNVRVGFFSWFADGWKTLRAFKVSDTTYLDEDLRIARGQTGSVAVFRKNIE